MHLSVDGIRVYDLGGEMKLGMDLWEIWSVAAVRL